MDQPSLILRTTGLLLMALMSTTDAKIDIINSKSDLLVGQDHLLLCKAGGDADITWQKDGEDIGEDDDNIVYSRVDETSSRLSIKTAQMKNTGTYTCVCDFTSGHKDETTTQIFVYEGPSFGATKVYHEFLKGQEGVVPCLASGQPFVDISWFRGGQSISSNEGERVHVTPNNALLITNVGTDDAGTYICRAKIRGRTIEKEQAISVVVNYLPTVRTKETVQNVTGGQKNNFSLVCSADGHPEPNLSWTMPGDFEPSRHLYNSDRSELTIRSINGADSGKYTCTASNKIGESMSTIMLHVSEAPEVYLSTRVEAVPVGRNVSLFCNVSGHPYPKMYWIDKHSGKTLDETSGRIHVRNGVLTINEVVPSDGGLYSCMAVSSSGNASRDVALHTEPGAPQHLSVSPGPTSVVFSLKTPPIDGGTPIMSYVLQRRRNSTAKWEETVVPASGPLVIPSLKPFTSYTVRLAAMNEVGPSLYSDTHDVRTLGIREPDSPVLISEKMKVEGNSLVVPFSHLCDGGSPLLHFKIRYRQAKEGSEWKEQRLAPDVASIPLSDLAPGADYLMEVFAVNAKGHSAPANLEFLFPKQAGMKKGSVVAIVMVIFLVVLVAVDVTCCYTNRCGLLMFIAVRFFGRRVPGLKTLEEGDGTVDGDLKLTGVDAPRGELHQHQVGVQTQTNEVTCDKAPLTKHEKYSLNRDVPTTDA